MPVFTLPKQSKNQWTLTLAGVTNTLAGWGLEGCLLETGSLITGAFTARRVVQRITDLALCAFDASAILRDHLGVVRFRGTRAHVPGNSAGRTENESYRFEDAWEELIDRKYEQLWTTTVTVGNPSPPPAQLSSKSTSYNPHLILNNGRTIGQELTAIIEYAASQGVPIAVGDIDADVYAPTDEVLCRDCASIIAQLATFCPGHIGWIDYEPITPTFNFLPQASLSGKSTPAFGVNSSEDLTIEARHKDVRSAVVLRYERLDRTTVDGVTRERPVLLFDRYPVDATGRERRALSEIISLAGSTRNTITADLDVRAFPADFSALAEVLTGGFWTEKQWNLQIDDPRISQNSLSIVAASFTREAAHTEGDDAPALVELPNYLVAGQIAPWMRDDNDEQILWQKQKLTIKVNYTQYYDPDAAIMDTAAKQTERVLDRTLSIYLTATNAPIGLQTYSLDTEVEDAEQPVAGLARFLYDQLSVLRYQGQRRRIQNECDGSITMGNVLNLTGGAPEWAAMNALVQSVLEDIDHGITTLNFGVGPRHTPGLLIALDRVTRMRRRWTAATVQSTGELT